MLKMVVKDLAKPKMERAFEFVGGDWLVQI